MLQPVYQNLFPRVFLQPVRKGVFRQVAITKNVIDKLAITKYIVGRTEIKTAIGNEIVKNIVDKTDVDDDDIYFLALQTFVEFRSIKNVYNDYNQKELARASRIGLRLSGLRWKKVGKNDKWKHKNKLYTIG